MPKPKRYYYLVDNLDPQRSDLIARGLKAVTTVDAVSVDLTQSIIEVVASRDPGHNVRTACEVAGSIFRTSIKKKHL